MSGKIFMLAEIHGKKPVISKIFKKSETAERHTVCIILCIDNIKRFIDLINLEST